MLQKITRLKFFARPLSLVVLTCSCLAASAAAQPPSRPPSEPRPPTERLPPIRPPATIKREVIYGPPPEPTIDRKSVV
jgi:hypothetical protein